jgi:hypothetical protein
VCRRKNKHHTTGAVRALKSDFIGVELQTHVFLPICLARHDEGAADVPGAEVLVHAVVIVIV